MFDDTFGLDPNPISVDDDDYTGKESETFGDGMPMLPQWVVVVCGTQTVWIDGCFALRYAE
jgi:hypothetical protein